MEDEAIGERIRALTEGYESEFVRLWSRNELSNAAGVVARCGGSAEDGSTRSLEDVDVYRRNLEYLTVPIPGTFRFLPEEDEALVNGPTGLMFCDVYERVGGEFLELADGSRVTDTSEVMGGVTGLGVEFFYGDATDRTVPSGWEFEVPVYRDYMTPSIPDRTLEALLDFGAGRDGGERTGWLESSSRSFRPKLKSTL